MVAGGRVRVRVSIGASDRQIEEGRHPGQVDGHMRVPSGVSQYRLEDAIGVVVFGRRRRACRRIVVEARRSHEGAGSGWSRVRNSFGK